MKRLFTILLLFFAGSAVFAQFTMTRTDFPIIGDAQYYSLVDSTGFDPGPGGTGQTWDFSTATPTGSNVTISFITPSSHPKGSNYPASNFCTSSSDGDYWFYNMNNDSLVLHGENSILATPVVYTDSATLFKFPLNFNDTQMDSVAGTYFDGFISSVSRKGFYGSSFDGSGTLITPYATYSNVNRLSYGGFFADSSWTGAANSSITLEVYEWYEQGKREPVFTYRNRVVVINGGAPTITKWIMYADTNTVAIDNAIEAANFEVYPSPSHGQFKVSFDLVTLSNVDVTMTDMFGKAIMTIYKGELSSGKQTFDINAQNISGGIYFVNLRSEGQSLTRKIVIQ